MVEALKKEIEKRKAIGDPLDAWNKTKSQVQQWRSIWITRLLASNGCTAFDVFRYNLYISLFIAGDAIWR